MRSSEVPGSAKVRGLALLEQMYADDYMLVRPNGDTLTRFVCMVLLS